MFCTQCGTELRLNDRFCSQCGKQWRFEGTSQGTRRLTRDMRNRKVAGVCAGFANYFNIDVTFIRIVLLTLALGFGAGFIAYLVAWIAMPKDDWTSVPPPAASQPVSSGL